MKQLTVSEFWTADMLLARVRSSTASSTMVGVGHIRSSSSPWGPSWRRAGTALGTQSTSVCRAKPRL